MLNSRLLKEALTAARKGDNVDLSELTIPWGGGHISKAEGDNAKASRSRQVMWSDRTIDEDNDTIEPSGWVLDRFLKNGPILWAHNNGILPIGKPENTRVEGQGSTGRLLGDVDFSKENPFAELVLRLVDEGVIRGTSVGFKPVKWLWNEERGGIDFIEQRLLEGSIVPVGSNPNSMIAAAQSKGLDMAPMIDWLEQCLDDEEIYTASPREELEVIHKALGPWKKTKGGVVVSEPTPEAATTPTPGETKLAEEATTMLGVMVEAIKSGELTRDIFDAPLAELGMVAESRGAISWDDAHPDGTPRAPKDAEWEVGGDWGDSALAHKSGLKHHTGPKHRIVWAGLTRTMDDLLSGDVEIPEPDRRAVYDHLARHYRDDFDEEPPEFRAPGEEPPVTAEEIGEMVQAGIVEMAEELRNIDGVTPAFVKETVEAAVKDLTREFLRESGRLPA